MPSETEKGVIKPLAAEAIPLIAWRLRYVEDPASRVLMTGIHSCANCHSVSRDGRTMAMDLDGPRNDKGLYAIFPVRPQAPLSGKRTSSPGATSRANSAASTASASCRRSHPTAATW